MALNSSQNFKAMAQHLIKVFPSLLHPLSPMWVQSGTVICFNFCGRLGFNVIWFVK